MKTWRERIATPLKRVEDEKSDEKPSDKLTNRTNPDLLRVGLSDRAVGQTSVRPDKPPDLPRPRLVRIGPTTWREAEWCRSLCVMCPNPLATGDVVACVAHRPLIDAEIAKWRED